MPDCPRCHQPVKSDAIACPFCRTPLSAYGHPGIPLHRATGTESLCQTCAYDADDSCNYPQRPFAKECTMYRDIRVSIVTTPTNYATTSPSIWVRRNLVWIVLAGLVLFSFWLALSKR